MSTINSLRHWQLSLATAVLSVVLLVSCSSHDKPGGSETSCGQNVLRYDVNAPFTSLNPAEVSCSGSTVVFPLLYSYLCVPNPKGELEPDLAEKWSYDSETRRWKILIRKNVRFHDGRLLTSKDVAYSFNNVLRRVLPAHFQLIEKISCPSDTEILITLKGDHARFLHNIWQAEIVPQDEIKTIDYFGHPIGSGPFKFRSRDGEREIVLEANREYYGGSPAIDQVVFFYQADKEKAWARILSGHTDIAQELSPKDYEMMRSYKERYYFDVYLPDYYSVLIYNDNDELFADPRVRLALSYAIDRNYIVRSILGGFGEVGTEEAMRFDPGKALSLLRRAGWVYDKTRCRLEKNEKPFQFCIFIFEEQQIEKRIAAYLQLCFSEIGIQTEIKTEPFQSIAARYHKNKDFQAIMTEYAGSYREFLKRAACPVANDHSNHPEVPWARISAGQDDLKDLTGDGCTYTLLFQKMAMDGMSRRFNLPFPFTLTHQGIYRLKYASLNRNFSCPVLPPISRK